MASLPYIQLYIADYLADTAHLTTAQHGAYLLLIFNYWQKGHALNNFNGRLTNVARMSNDEWTEAQQVLSEFFEIDGDVWTHPRIEADLAEVRAKTAQKSRAGRISAGKRSTAVQQTFNERSTKEEEEEEEDKDKDKDKDLKEGGAAVVLTTTPAVVPVLVFPIIGKEKDFLVVQSDLDEWQDTFPGVDVLEEVKKCRLWNVNNPARRKTARGIRTHICAWLGKEQDNGKGRGRKTARPVIENHKEGYAEEMLKNAFNKEHGLAGDKNLDGHFPGNTETLTDGR